MAALGQGGMEAWQEAGGVVVVEGTLAAAWTAVTYMMMFSVANRGCGRDGTFCENSCERLQAHVPANLFGQVTWGKGS